MALPLRQIVEHFEQVDIQHDLNPGDMWVNPMSVYVPSPIRDVTGALRYLKSHALIPEQGLVFVAGSADKRINHLFEHVGHYHTLGMEKNPQTYHFGLQQDVLLQDRLKEKYRAPITTIGDFTDIAQYWDLFSLPFSSIDIFYNYASHPQEMAGLIAEHAKNGAVFLLLNHDTGTPYFDGLSHRHRHTLCDDVLTLDGIRPGLHLDVYEHVQHTSTEQYKVASLYFCD